MPSFVELLFDQAYTARGKKISQLVIATEAFRAKRKASFPKNTVMYRTYAEAFGRPAFFHSMSVCADQELFFEMRALDLNRLLFPKRNFIQEQQRTEGYPVLERKDLA